MFSLPAISPRALHLVPRLLMALVLLAVSAQAQTPMDIRVALVIGNAAYAGQAALANPVNDAKAMAEKLRKLGFQVMEVSDASRSDMTQAIEKMRAQLHGKSGVGMLYYAGHGLQIDWRNYMLPVDLHPKTQADVVNHAVNVDTVLNAFKQAGNRVNILVLDACRDNPFEGTTSAKGLAQIDAVPGTFLAYATAPGNTADDGEGDNGLYTGFLLQELSKPNTRIEDVFKRVRLQVRQKSRGTQIPWESTSLEEDFAFNEGRTPTRNPGATPSAAQVLKERDRMFAVEKAAWDRIKDSTDPSEFFAFLQAHPNGTVSEAAQSRLDELAKPQIVTAPVQGRHFVQRDARLGDEVDYVYYDNLTKLEIRRETQRVTAIKDGRIEINRGAIVVTKTGGTVRNDYGGDFDPPLQNLPVDDFQIGKKWLTRSQQTLPLRGGQPSRMVGWIEADLKVAAYEKVTVPAGTIDAYRIDGRLRNQNGVNGTMVVWVDSTGTAVKTVRSIKVTSHMGFTRDDSWTREATRIHKPR